MAGDLHCHTRLSDGSIGIEDLIALAKSAGLKTIAVTDHDTYAGAMRAKILGERSGLQVLPGVEFSCQDKETGKKVHLLCYMPEYPDRLQGLCKEILEKRKVKGQYIAAEIMRRYPIPVSLIKKWATGSTSLYKQHIMAALMDAGYTTNMYGNLYNKLFVSPEGINNNHIDYPDVRDVLEQIHEACGIAVMAHPFMYDNFDLIPELAGLGLDGIEVWHPSHTEENVEKLIDLAKKYDLCITGGSDFHGSFHSRPTPIGSCTVEDIFVDRLIAAKKRLLKINLTK